VVVCHLQNTTKHDHVAFLVVVGADPSIQGMNEIIGPIYFVLSQDPDLKWSRHAEADTFYCFTQGKEIKIFKFLRRKWPISCFANLLSWPIL
jgi:hypothetical protein